MNKMKKVASAEVKKHEQRMHKMAKGGVTSAMAQQMGRNMARVKNQGKVGK